MAAGQPSALQFILRLNDRITGPMGRVVRTVTGQARSMAADVNRATGLMQSGFIAATAGALALAAVFASPISAAAAFESQMASVRAVTQATAAEMSGLTKTARRLGATTSFSASQAAQGMQFLGQAGFKTNQIIAAMPGVLDIAKAGSLELGRAADIASDILSGFGLRAAQMGRVGDVLTKTFISSNTNLEMLGGTMKFVGPIASSVGESLETMAAAAGLLGNVGIKASQAGTALRAILLRLSAPTGEAAARLKSLGVATSDSAGRFLGMTPILEKLAAATTGLGNAARLGAFKRIFGEEAAAAAVQLVKQAGSGGLQPFIEKLENARGTANRVAREMDENLRGKLLGLKSAWESLNITIGNLFLPMLTTLVESITGTVRKFEVWTARFPHLTRLLFLGAGAVLVMAVAVGVAKIAFGLLTLAMVPFRIVLLAAKAAMWLMRGAILLTKGAVLAFAGAMLLWKGVMLLWKGVMLLATGAMWLFNAALWANPITWIVVGVIALGAAIVLAVIHWDKLKAAGGAALSWIGEKLKGVKTWFGDFWEALPVQAGFALGLVAAQFTPDGIIAHWETVKGWFAGFWDWLPGGFRRALDAVVGIFAKLPAQIAGIFTSVTASVAGFFRDIPGLGAIFDIVSGTMARKREQFTGGFAPGLAAGASASSLQTEKAETPASLAGLPAPEPLSGEARRALSNVANTDNSRRIQIEQVVIHPKEEVGPDFLTRTLVAEGLG